MRADEAEKTAQSVERLNHRGDQRGVAAVARKHLADREFQAADQLVGLLLFLIGHVGRLLQAAGTLWPGSHRTYQICRARYTGGPWSTRARSLQPSGSCCCRGVPASSQTQVFDVAEKTIPELAAAMRSGATTSKRLVQAYLDRIEAFDQSKAKLPLDKAEASTAAGGENSPYYVVAAHICVVKTESNVPV